MSKSIPSNATPAMLKWARESEGLTVPVAAKRLRVAPELLEKWERGDETPSLPRLEKLAKLYRRVTPVFYLPEPTNSFSIPKLKDFRTLPSGVPRVWSQELRYAVRRAHELQEWAASMLEDDGAGESALVGSASSEENAGSVGKEIRRQLNVSLVEQRDAPSDHQAFEMWRDSCERLGIFVFQTSAIDLQEMRGFAIPHKLAPVVVVNSLDASTARSFTLFHEIGHILLGLPAVVGSGDIFEPQAKSELFCNKMAAEILVPSEDFRARVPSDWQSRDDDVLREFARFYHVSRSMIAFRLAETGFTKPAYYFEKLSMLKPKKKSRTKGPIRTMGQRVLGRFGRAFCRLAIGEFQSGRIHGGELTRLLGMSLKHIPDLEGAIHSEHVRT